MNKRDYVPEMHIVQLIQSDVNQELPSGQWVPARTYSCPSLLRRIKSAWKVVTGDAMAVTWQQQEARDV